MNKIILCLILIVSLSFSFDKYLKDKNVYLCKLINTNSTHDHDYDSLIYSKIIEYLSEDINFVNGKDIYDKKIISYHKLISNKFGYSYKPPKFHDDFKAEYYIILNAEIKEDYRENTPATFNIISYSTIPKRLGSFTIGDDGKKYYQYYVKIEVLIYSVATGELYFSMENENDSHSESIEYDKEITYNIIEVIEDFSDMFNDRKAWRYYKKSYKAKQN